MSIKITMSITKNLTMFGVAVALIISFLFILRLQSISHQPGIKHRYHGISPADTAGHTLPWWKTTTIYQIYPRSFQDSDGDGIGDIQGIIQRLDYFQELGVETLWLSGIHVSPQRDFGYDVSDYTDVDREYGSMQDLEQLIAEAHRRGLKILMDMVLNHTSENHIWFCESSSACSNNKENWYIWRDGRGKSGLQPPNNWKSLIGDSGWHYSKRRKQWYFTSFLPFQPDLNYRDTTVKTKMFDILRFWLNKGIDGFRLDMANVIMKDSAFRDNPFSFNPFPTLDNPGGNFQYRQYSANHPDNYQFVQELRRVMEEFSHPERILLGEVFGTHETIRPYLHHKKKNGLHLIFLFDMIFFDFDADFFRTQLIEYEHHYPSPFIPTIVFSNHDQKRSIGKVGNNPEHAKLLALYQLTARGVPTIYQGEEIGLKNGTMPLKTALDPMAQRYSWLPSFLERRLPVLVNRDNCRTPMQWDSSRYAGFMPASSEHRPWLPLLNDYRWNNVLAQKANVHSLFVVYQSLLALRKQYPAFHKGSLTVLELPEIPDDVLVFQRKWQQQTLTIMLNFSSDRRTIHHTFGHQIFSLHNPTNTGKIVQSSTTIEPFSGVILQQQ